jgi:hypothetical protein
MPTREGDICEGAVIRADMHIREGAVMAKRIGFQRMDPVCHRELAREAGIASQKSGHAYKLTPYTAQLAGKRSAVRRAQLRRARILGLPPPPKDAA